MKKILLLIASAALAVCLVGCGESKQAKQDPICGTWQATSYELTADDGYFGNSEYRPVYNTGIPSCFENLSPVERPVDLFMVISEDGTAYLYTDNPSDGDITLAWEKSDNEYLIDEYSCNIINDQMSLTADVGYSNSLCFKKISDE